MRDAQRKRVYESEFTFRRWCYKEGHTVTFGDVFTAEQFVKEVFEGQVCKRYQVVDWCPTLRRKRGESLTTYSRYAKEIAVASWGWTNIVLLHEMAHHITPDEFPSHGAEFVARLLDLVEAHMSYEAFTKLQSIYMQNKVESWRDPYKAIASARTILSTKHLPNVTITKRNGTQLHRELLGVSSRGILVAPWGYRYASNAHKTIPVVELAYVSWP